MLLDSAGYHCDFGLMLHRLHSNHEVSGTALGTGESPDARYSVLPPPAIPLWALSEALKRKR